MKSAIFVLIVLQVISCTVEAIWSTSMENKGLFEGDIVLFPEERAYSNGTFAYGSMIGGRWPGGILPYMYDKYLEPEAIKVIEEAMAEYKIYTCIRFKKRTNEKSYLKFYKGSGCSSPIGYHPDRHNPVSIGDGCHHKGIVQHEIGHSLGFYHEQSRPDRDSYIKIHFENIKPGMAYNFQKAPSGAIDSLGTPYDLESMMHYGATAFTTNKKRTIEVLDWRKRLLIGQRRTFSDIDVLQLNLMYKCHTQHRTVPPKVCEDTSSSCNFYKGFGYCTSEHNEIWMYKICCKTCFGKTGGHPASPPPTKFPPKTTHTPTPGCVDRESKHNCSYWARIGKCESTSKVMRDFMKKKCCATCRDHHSS